MIAAKDDQFDTARVAFSLLLLLLLYLLLPLLPLLVLKSNHYTIALHLFTITRLLVASLLFSFSPPPPPFLLYT